MVTLAQASNKNTRDLITVADVTNLGDCLLGTAGYGQLIRLHALSDATNYTNILGNVDTTNGRALQVQYGLTASPTVLAQFAKAGIVLNVQTALKQVATPSDPGSTYTALYAKNDSLLYFFPTGGAETRLAKYTETPTSVLTTTGDTLYASGANTPARLAIGTAFQELVVNSGATAPQWSSGVLARVTTAGDIVQATGANAIARLAIGTANQTLLVNAGATALAYGASLQSLMTAAGDIVYASGANTPARLAKGSNGDFLTLSSGIPAWAAAPGGFTKLDEQTGTGSSGVLTFSAISGAYRELEISIYGRSSTASTQAAVQITINGNTTATDYNSEQIFAATTTVFAAQNVGSIGYIPVGSAPAANSTANVYSAMKIWIPEYANTSNFKAVIAMDAGILTLASGNFTPQMLGGLFESTSAITSIAITLSSGNWTTASRATLWGKTT